MIHANIVKITMRVNENRDFIPDATHLPKAGMVKSGQ